MVIDYMEDRYCPVYERIIHELLCYETVVVAMKLVKPEWMPELKDVQNYEQKLRNCDECHYSDFGGDED